MLYYRRCSVSVKPKHTFYGRRKPTQQKWVALVVSHSIAQSKHGIQIHVVKSTKTCKENAEKWFRKKRRDAIEGAKPRHADAVHSCRRLVPYFIYLCILLHAQQWFDGRRAGCCASCAKCLFVWHFSTPFYHSIRKISCRISLWISMVKPTECSLISLFWRKKQETKLSFHYYFMPSNTRAAGVRSNSEDEGTSSKHFQWINAEQKANSTWSI